MAIFANRHFFFTLRIVLISKLSHFRFRKIWEIDLKTIIFKERLQRLKQVKQESRGNFFWIIYKKILIFVVLNPDLLQRGASWENVIIFCQNWNTWETKKVREASLFQVTRSCVSVRRIHKPKMKGCNIYRRQVDKRIALLCDIIIRIILKIKKLFRIGITEYWI